MPTPNGNTPLNPQQQLARAQQANMAARQLILQNAIEATQQIYTTTSTAGMGTVLTIPCHNVGFVKKFLVEVNATISGSAGVTHTLSKIGAANLLSNITLTDLNNQQRINTTGWHLMAVQSAKYREIYGAASVTDTPLGYGNNITNTMNAPLTITGTAASTNVNAIFEVPVTYSDHDLRGGIYAGVVGATFQLQVTISPTVAVASGVDATLAVYQSSTSTVATLPSFTVTVYQVYLDQLPMGNNGPILPLMDMGQGYFLNNTTLGGLVANQDLQIQYANFREFMSTTVVFDNGGNLNPGTDVVAWKLQTANLVNLFNVTANVVSLWTRLRISADMPTGMYYFDHRQKPIATLQSGNMALLGNFSTVNTNASLLIGFESIGQFNQVLSAGSLYGT